MRKSSATWSLRDRAVCSRPAGAPIISLRRASTVIWMSSSAVEKVKLPASISCKTCTRPASMAVASSGWRIPVAASMAAWAREPAISCGARRLSNPIEALIASMIASGPALKRPPHIVFADFLSMTKHPVQTQFRHGYTPAPTRRQSARRHSARENNRWHFKEGLRING